MNRTYTTLLITLTVSSMTQAQTPILTPPKAAVKPKELITNGHKRIDNYYYLNERENPEVINYLKAENAYLDQVLAPVKDLQAKLFEEMKGRIKQQDESVPYKEGEYYYYSRYITGGEYPIYCRRKGSMQGNEEVMFDGNVMAKGHNYYQLGGYEISDNEELAIFAEDTVSRRLYTLRIKNLKTGKIYPEAIQNTEAGSFAWATDNKTLFYIKKDPQTLLGYQVYRHTLGADPKTDVLVYEEQDNQFYMGLSRSKSKKYIEIGVDHNGVATEYRLLEASKPLGEFKVFLPREKGHEYDIVHYKDKFYVRTNWKAENFRLMEVPEGKTADRASWKEVIPHRADVYLANMDVFVNHLVLGERKAGLTNIRIINQQQSGDPRSGDPAKVDEYLDFGEPAYVAGIGYNPDFNTNVLRYSYSSLTTPNSTFDYNMDTKEKTLMKQQEVLGGFDKDNYVSERMYATARDGVKVPISLVYRKGTKKDGSAPLLQYAYGSYGYSTDPGFSSTRLSLLDRGFIFAIAHIRGGQEMGRRWYEDGKMLKKKNTFNDFVDVSEYLIKNQYTSADKLFAMGGSAGGLLMGAVINQAPQLYRGVVAAVPFVDVVTTMLDESIPLTTGEFEEWGNPKNEPFYKYMLSYSPYDNVEKKAYPNLLVTTGLHDSQVQYWEPAKWVAKLRTLKTDNNQLLLHTNMEAGHGGASGRFQALKEIALEYAFMLNLVGVRM
ncbi:S9 family peptidase [Spirosoma koreense]